MRERWRVWWEMADRESRARLGVRGPVLAALALILLFAATLRLRGLAWDEAQHLHPDERFLTMVAGAIEAPARLGDYFNTAISPLNPHNRNFGFYVYGTFPIWMVRLTAVILHHDGYDGIPAVGRTISSLLDLGVLVLIFAIALPYGEAVALLACLFYASCVLPIQLSHFFTVDPWANFFIMSCLYLAIRVAREPSDGLPRRRVCLTYGLMTGLAIASKVSSVPIALFWPLALYLRSGKKLFSRHGLVALAAAGFTAALTFRCLQPYAFAGPGFWNLSFNPRWLANLFEIARLSKPDVGFPPAVQWFNRPRWFAWWNMVRWGMGLPLGLCAWTAYLVMGWRLFYRREKAHAILWLWTAIYFAFQGIAMDAPTMRYQLPIYPTLLILAAWLLFRVQSDLLRRGAMAGIAGATLAWGLAFHSIYERPVSRVMASEWIFENVPGAISLEMENWEGAYRQPISVSYSRRLNAESGVEDMVFSPKYAGFLVGVKLPHVLTGSEATLSLLISDAAGKRLSPVQFLDVTGLDAELNFAFRSPVALEDGKAYHLVLRAEEGEVALEGARIANETSWDDGLPLRVGGYDPFGGVYAQGMNLELYGNDDEGKRQRVLHMLERADFVSISSNRVWNTLTRLPDLYPFVARYYRELLGCPADRTIEWCYAKARPGAFQGKLGFELVKVFESYPRLGPWEVNDQYAEEAFTVYDHPKVFLFKKMEPLCKEALALR